MARHLVEGTRISKCKSDGDKFTTGVLAIAATLTLTDDHPDMMDVDPSTTSQKVLMPLASNENEGRVYRIYNRGTSSGTLVVKDSTDATTFGTIPVTKCAEVWNIGGTWRVHISA